MLATELIAELQRLVRDHGDREVTACWYEIETVAPVDDIQLDDGQFLMTCPDPESWWAEKLRATNAS